MSISGPAAHSLSLVARRAIHLRSRRLQRQAPRPPVMPAARETLDVIVEGKVAGRNRQ